MDFRPIPLHEVRISYAASNPPPGRSGWTLSLPLPPAPPPGYECSNRFTLFGCEEGSFQFIVSCCNAPELLQSDEESFDDVSLFIKREGGLPWMAPVSLRRNDRCDLPFSEFFDERISIISLVGDKGFGIDFIKERFCFSDVRPCPGVRERATPFPAASTTAWIFVVSLPRDRPMA